MPLQAKAALLELVSQAGPPLRLHIPRDSATGGQKSFAFAEFAEAASARYAVSLLEGLQLRVAGGPPHKLRIRLASPT